jgi:pimeloyl-ACP methyl ester carboxylesterase
MIRHNFFEKDGIRLYYAAAGEGKLILFAHGFPEFWYSWKNQLEEFGRTHFAVAPDLRGYNLSSKPSSVADYKISVLVDDLLGLAENLGYQKFTLVGHDWGGALAWALAIAHPERVEKLVIINAPHLATFARELKNNWAQRRASWYILLFRTPLAEMLLRFNGYAALVRSTLRDGLNKNYFDERDRQAYLEAWSQPGALTGGLNYYRALPLTNLLSKKQLKIPGLDAESFVVRVPTLVLWGEKDPYLLRGNLDGLEEFVPDLTVRRFPDASHWIVHEQPAVINSAIREFL